MVVCQEEGRGFMDEVVSHNECETTSFPVNCELEVGGVGLGIWCRRFEPGLFRVFHDIWLLGI